MKRPKATLDPDSISGRKSELSEEYENQAVPMTARKPLASVAFVWLGFPMIMTSAVFGGLIVFHLGFVIGLLAITVGNVILAAYVCVLSVLAGRTGESFSLTARRTFGTAGYRFVTAFLASLVIGWFAFQTGMVGNILRITLGWNPALVALLAGACFVALTFVGIRALAVIGTIASLAFVALGIAAIALSWNSSSFDAVGGYRGDAGTTALSFGACVTLVVACFVDSGTMTGDFTRWARSGRDGFLAAFAAFPLGNMFAQLVGAIIVALGAATDPATTGGDFLAVLMGQGGILAGAAVGFVFVNLGSVCAHCLYNGAIGWSQITGGSMRLLTLVLGIVGVTAAVAGVWSLFPDWLTVLGVVVPPIGIVLILDNFAVSVDRDGQQIRWIPFAAWSIGASCALISHFWARELSDAVVALVVAGTSFVLLTRISDTTYRATRANKGGHR